MVSVWLLFLGREGHCYNTLLDKDMLKFVRLLVEPNLTMVKAVTTASQIESAINNARMSLLLKRNS